jgi:type I restriction enzyme M protein
MFYNTGIATYIWVLNNRKPEERQGQVQLIDASGDAFWSPMRKSLGSKRRQMAEAQINEVLRLFGDWSIDSPHSKIFDTTAFGYRRIKVQRPLRLAFHPHDETRRAALAEDKAWQKLSDSDQGEILDALDGLPERLDDRTAFLKGLKGLKLKKPVLNLLTKHLGESDPDAVLCTDAAGNIEPDPSLTDYEQVPLTDDIEAYFAREVTPHVPEAWIDVSYRDAKDGGIGVVGYEINFNRYFYQYVPPRPLEDIDADLKAVEAEIAELLAEVTE